MVGYGRPAIEHIAIRNVETHKIPFIKFPAVSEKLISYLECKRRFLIGEDLRNCERMDKNRKIYADTQYTSLVFAVLSVLSLFLTIVIGLFLKQQDILWICLFFTILFAIISRSISMTSRFYYVPAFAPRFVKLVGEENKMLSFDAYLVEFNSTDIHLHLQTNFVQKARWSKD